MSGFTPEADTQAASLLASQLMSTEATFFTIPAAVALHLGTLVSSHGQLETGATGTPYARTLQVSQDGSETLERLSLSTGGLTLTQTGLNPLGTNSGVLTFVITATPDSDGNHIVRASREIFHLQLLPVLDNESSLPPVLNNQYETELFNNDPLLPDLDGLLAGALMDINSQPAGSTPEEALALFNQVLAQLQQAIPAK